MSEVFRAWTEAFMKRIGLVADFGEGPSRAEALKAECTREGASEAGATLGEVENDQSAKAGFSID